MKINTTIDDEIDNKFRKEIVKRFGYKKGNFQRALEEAITNWIKDA